MAASSQQSTSLRLYAVKLTRVKFDPVLRVVFCEASEAPLNADDVGHSVLLLQALDERPEHHILAGAYFADRCDRGLTLGRVAVDLLSGGGPLKLEGVLEVSHLLVELLLQNKVAKVRELRMVIVSLVARFVNWRLHGLHLRVEVSQVLYLRKLDLSLLKDFFSTGVG